MNRKGTDRLDNTRTNSVVVRVIGVLLWVALGHSARVGERTTFSTGFILVFGALFFVSNVLTAEVSVPKRSYDLPAVRQDSLPRPGLEKEPGIEIASESERARAAVIIKHTRLGTPPPPPEELERRREEQQQRTRERINLRRALIEERLARRQARLNALKSEERVVKAKSKRQIHQERKREADLQKAERKRERTSARREADRTARKQKRVRMLAKRDAERLRTEKKRTRTLARKERPPLRNEKSATAGTNAGQEAKPERRPSVKDKLTVRGETVRWEGAPSKTAPWPEGDKAPYKRSTETKTKITDRPVQQETERKRPQNAAPHRRRNKPAKTDAVPTRKVVSQRELAQARARIRRAKRALLKRETAAAKKERQRIDRRNKRTTRAEGSVYRRITRLAAREYRKAVNEANRIARNEQRTLRKAERRADRALHRLERRKRRALRLTERQARRDNRKAARAARRAARKARCAARREERRLHRLRNPSYWTVEPVVAIGLTARSGGYSGEKSLETVSLQALAGYHKGWGGLSLRSGLIASVISSKVSASETTTEMVAETAVVRVVDNPDGTRTEVTGTVRVPRTVIRETRFYNQLTSTDIPVLLGYRLKGNKYALLLEAGPSLNLSSGGDAHYRDGEEFRKVGGNHFLGRRPGVGFLGILTGEYKLSEKNSLVGGVRLRSFGRAFEDPEVSENATGIFTVGVQIGYRVRF